MWEGGRRWELAVAPSLAIITIHALSLSTCPASAFSFAPSLNPWTLLVENPRCLYQNPDTLELVPFHGRTCCLFLKPPQTLGKLRTRCQINSRSRQPRETLHQKSLGPSAPPINPTIRSTPTPRSPNIFIYSRIDSAFHLNVWTSAISCDCLVRRTSWSSSIACMTQRRPPCHSC